jgi:hypothetical protein
MTDSEIRFDPLVLEDAAVKLTVPTREIRGTVTQMSDLFLRHSGRYRDCRITYDEATGVRIEFFGCYYA